MVLLNGSNIKTSKKVNYLKITYADPINGSNELDVYYKLQTHAVVSKWVERLTSAQKLYNIDNPSRFYGIGSYQNQLNQYQQELETCITAINKHRHIIDRVVNWPPTQDDLNFLHHIFEVYHGLLDQQIHDFFVTADNETRLALANLNILVHKGESLLRGNKPRHVVTYFGLPKNKKLKQKDYQYFADQIKFGSVYLNYVEIGKTLEDLAMDDDHYIDQSAFKPFRHFSADFVVMFFDTDQHALNKKNELIHKFYEKNRSFFMKHKLNFDHPYMKPGRIPLADIDSHGREVLQLLETRQFVKCVQLI